MLIDYSDYVVSDCAYLRSLVLAVFIQHDANVRPPNNKSHPHVYIKLRTALSIHILSTRYYDYSTVAFTTITHVKQVISYVTYVDPVLSLENCSAAMVPSSEELPPFCVGTVFSTSFFHESISHCERHIINIRSLVMCAQHISPW